MTNKDQAHGVKLSHRATGIERGDLLCRHSPVRKSFAAVLAWTGGRAVQLVRAGEYEAFYSGMPLIGLAKAGARSAVTAETDSARQRLGAGAK